MSDQHENRPKDKPEGASGRAGPGLYDAVGGDDGVRKLVDRFYDLMDTLPEARTIRDLHPESLKESRVKLYEFLSGWLGGPQLYIEKRGHPRLRARHLPFSIDDDAVGAWLLCMERAIDEQIDDEEINHKLKGGLRPLAQHMANQ
jgi:hemoglobin